MKHINVHFPEIIPYAWDDINMDIDENGTVIASLKQAPLYKKLDDNFFDTVTVFPQDTWGNKAFERDGTDSLTALLIGDSYMGHAGQDGFLIRYIPQHFGKTVLFHCVNMGNLTEYINTFNPDIVVFETAERSLGYFFDFLSRLEL
jgi:hypothetical protein